jgi:hypothetical protein
MHSPCMKEKDYSNRRERQNRTRRRDFPNPSTILQVPKTLHIPRRRRRERSSLTKTNHEESTCMKKQINLMGHVLQQNNLGNFIPKGVKKQKEEDPAPKKGNHHALVAINSSYDSWIIDSGASHDMEAKEEVFTCLSSCS